VLGGNDFDGETAERYGYVNRALPTASWMVSWMRSRGESLPSIGVRSLAAKNLINEVSLPPADRLLDALNSFTTALTWPETQQRFQALFKRGLNRPGDMENRFAELLATFMDT